ASRRRHTRLQGDWSSDVCSSDLRRSQFTTNLVLAEIYQPAGKLQEARKALENAQALINPGPPDSEIDGKLIIEMYGRLADVYKRSEERRVGRECRARRGW